jgi:glucuronoarabinoxylan endo-1,4-beta-xylanase
MPAPPLGNSPVPASVRQIRVVLFLVSFCLLPWVVLLLPVLWSPAVTVNFAATRQTIDGFGASATGYTADLSAEQADRFFNPATGLGLSLLRVKAIAGTLDMDCGCVSNHSPYKCEAGSGSQILTGDLHVAELAAARGIKIFASPWSPPAEMKTSKKYCGGGSMMGDAGNYTRYAAELASFPPLLKTHGVSLDTLSIQNEPNVEDSNYDTCLWTPQQIHDFIPYLFDALRAAGFDAVKIGAPEQTSWRFDMMKTAMDDPAIAGKIGLLLGHAYNSERPRTLPSERGLHVWETEVGGFQPYDGSMADALNWASYIHNYMALGANAWMYWNLDCGEFYFNAKNNMCLTDHASRLAKRAYVLGQYAKFIRPGWQRIDATNRGLLRVTAFKGPGNKFAVVLVNPSRFTISSQRIFLNGASAKRSQIVPWITSSTNSLAAQPPISLEAEGSMFRYTIPARSVVTFQGQAD